ncbi:hypothetical protein AB0E66_27605 [Streptomyces sp. NPDC033753]|uniref:hypothetical protein n=1 Tax=Streptomyces sp. NPDC033753 TaxID=3155128 RepID=UPI00340023DD
MARDQPGPDRAAEGGEIPAQAVVCVDGLVIDRLINGGPVTEKEIATLGTAALH